MNKLTEEIKELEENLEKARKAIHNEGMKDGISKYEYPYGIAYQKLVTAGLRPKLRIKYRP